MYDLKIKNAKIVDGTGLKSFHGDIAVIDGTIVDIVLTNGGSGYTKAPRVVVAKQYSIKKQNRKID